MNLHFDVYSENFDARRALLFARPDEIVLPYPNMKPFDFLDRCRYLLEPSDPDYVAPPQRRNTHVAAGATSSTVDNDSSEQQTSSHHRTSHDDDDDDNERHVNDHDNADAADDDDKTSGAKKVPFFTALMSSLTNPISLDLADAREQKRRVRSF
jgi:hypothetical protein